MKPRKPSAKTRPTTLKSESLEPHRMHAEGKVLTTDQGIPISDTDNSLKAGIRGPTLLEDFHFREKMMRFDHERIPERAVHARGAGAHGYFQVYKSLEKYTQARFLTDPSLRTPVFVRFSTVGGSRGSADTVRDVRGFATKFYTEEGTFDLVGNNMPVFFIQDGIKFPDFVHAVKPEPHNEIPQASSAHDSLWDFVSLVPETTHMIMWLMSDRAIPRSFRMMEGFGVHTFRLVNAAGKATLVKFHWKPLLGNHALAWDEAQKLSGKDPDFHRRDLWESIEKGDFAEYELGLQFIPEGDELKYGFDLLDATKLLPEELVPVQRVGKLTLNRNPDNFFAETEQVAFCVANVVPGIDFTNDPLMQARLFSYLDTQLTRLGGPNFAELPINKPVCPVTNHQQDGFGRQTIPTSRANYHPNSLGGGCPVLANPTNAFRHYQERVEGHKIRARSGSFSDHFSQATLFYKSLSKPEQEHLVAALEFEIGKVERVEIRERVVNQILVNVDPELAVRVARAVGVTPPKVSKPPKPSKAAGKKAAPSVETSPALSMENSPHDSIRTRKIAALVSDGFAGKELDGVRKVLEERGATLELVGPTLSPVTSQEGREERPLRTFSTASSVMYDAVYVPGGEKSVAALRRVPLAVDFVREAYVHCKALALSADADTLLDAAGVRDLEAPPSKGLDATRGVVRSAKMETKGFGQLFAESIARRHWEREAPPPA
ncbi:catalase [Myxococcus xanthus]|uniref:Catalase n=1 Tax=Myxococcus xanthus TaxID=34 RepID=A0AAE6G525_MYXXA|nr:catalase [Myxococcus xanthus]QDE71066.1 catalase HPII [Myxococcus xanthus]QDE78346.1 catalase HPII [Myxococcus xanthus]QDE99889.1 catalase HPII [Myxococcus xanthus]